MPSSAACCEGCGLTDVEVAAIAYTHASATIDEIWDGLLSGTVRTSALIRPQPAAIQREIRAAFEQRTAPYWRDGRVVLPIAVKLARGRRQA